MVDQLNEIGRRQYVNIAASPGRFRPRPLRADQAKPPGVGGDRSRRATSAGALSQVSISSLLVKMTGLAFGHLQPEVVRKVVEKFILQLEAQLSERQINIKLSTEAADWFAK
jgi:hypothetical protein